MESLGLTLMNLLSRATEMTGPLKPYHAEFLQTLMAEYSGEKLTKVTLSRPDVFEDYYLTGVGLRKNFARGSA